MQRGFLLGPNRPAATEERSRSPPPARRPPFFYFPGPESSRIQILPSAESRWAGFVVAAYSADYESLTGAIEARVAPRRYRQTCALLILARAWIVDLGTLAFHARDGTEPASDDSDDSF
jgi:hypothetical protein